MDSFRGSGFGALPELPPRLGRRPLDVSAVGERFREDPARVVRKLRKAELVVRLGEDVERRLVRWRLWRDEEGGLWPIRRGHGAAARVGIVRTVHVSHG